MSTYEHGEPDASSTNPWEKLGVIKPAESGCCEGSTMKVCKAPAEGDTIQNAAGGKQAHVDARLDLVPAECLLLLGECLSYGLKYGEDNWKKIAQRDHLNHAMVHLTKWRTGDRTEPHLVNAIARLNFACWQAVNEGEQPVKYLRQEN